MPQVLPASQPVVITRHTSLFRIYTYIFIWMSLICISDTHHRSVGSRVEVTELWCVWGSTAAVNGRSVAGAGAVAINDDYDDR